MKKIIFLSIMLAAFASCSTTHQLSKSNNNYVQLKKFNRDTLTFLKSNFQGEKAKYIGKPLSSILNDLEVPVKSYFLGQGGATTDIYTVCVSLYDDAYRNQVIMDQQRPPLVIIISIDKPIPYNSDIMAMRAKDKGNWTKTEADYFGKLVVKDININDR